MTQVHIMKLNFQKAPRRSWASSQFDTVSLTMIFFWFSAPVHVHLLRCWV